MTFEHVHYFSPQCHDSHETLPRFGFPVHGWFDYATSTQCNHVQADIGVDIDADA
jgi:hypothetical protein